MTTNGIVATNGIAAGSGDAHVEEFDVIVIGAGFGGIYLLHNLRNLGYKVKVLESGKGLGGVWWWNAYPGARVDTYWPFYQFAAKETWNDWLWKEKYPSREELLQYFEHVEAKWDVKKDIRFDAFVTEASFDETHDKWTVCTSQGYKARAQFLLPCTGFAAKRYVPPIKGLETFNGVCHHTAVWPQEGVDLKGKRVGVIGTGATGVQVIQEIASQVGHLSIFQRTANTAFPMRQRIYDDKTVHEQTRNKDRWPEIYRIGKTTFAGWDFDSLTKKSSEDTPEQRIALWEHLWEGGGFLVWQANYSDLMTDEGLNRAMYDFWRDKVREILVGVDAETVENMAPYEPENPFGSKRPSLEQTFYDIFAQPNIKVHNIKKNPIAEVTPTGVTLSSGEEIDLDVLVLATGFDSVTGSLMQIDITGVNGAKLADKWAQGIYTQFGMASAGFPNMFFMYGPQAPTAFAIGPRTAELQGDWIVQTLEDMKRHRHSRIDATPEAEAIWRKETNDLFNETLIPRSTSWYVGANIPGKPRESLNYLGGFGRYGKHLKECTTNAYKGFLLK